MTLPAHTRRISPFSTAALRALDHELGAALPRVLTSSDDEAIHDMRVAIRRLRTFLKLLRPVYGRFHVDAVRGHFTLVHRATGALRDEEVLEETLDQADGDERSLSAAHPSFVDWRVLRRRRERQLRRTVLTNLHSGDLTRARTLLKALLALPVDPKRDRDLAKFARRCVERARRGVEARRDVLAEDVEGLHDLRIAYKELRYAAELLAGALPADLAATADPAARFQKRLGELHDIDVAISAVARARILSKPARVALLARLRAMRTRRTEKYLLEMRGPSTLRDDEGQQPSGTAPPAPRARSRLADRSLGTKPEARSL